MPNIQPTRSKSVKWKTPEGKAVQLTKTANVAHTIWASDSNSHFVDVLSIGEIGGVLDTYLNGTSISEEEFPNSTVFTHNGLGKVKPWSGNNYPYTERSISVGKTADVFDKEGYTETVVNREVSTLGVVGIKINFTTGGFTHRDEKGRRWVAGATFKVQVKDPSTGFVVKTQKYLYNSYFASNPTAVTLSIDPPEGYENKIWAYTVTMGVRGRYVKTPVTGSWSLSTVTELFNDTQTYDKIAFASGTLTSQDVSGTIPKREYLVMGYKVRIPLMETVLSKPVWLGKFIKETSNSHAWNILAVLTDDLWGGNLPIDKINMDSFIAFEEYCATQIGGTRRYSFSQNLIKADHYFKIASQMAGSADSKLFEDTSGRIGIFIDKEITERRLITSYDIVDEKVKKITVPRNKKINYIKAEFEDESNKYEKAIIHVEDDASILKNGIVSKNIKLDTCTNAIEADRIIRRMLATSQHISASFQFKVGFSHEDIQIGEIVELYDRVSSQNNYCGKIGIGSTLQVIQVDKRTPLNLSSMTGTNKIAIWNGTEVIRADISSWTSESITLQAPLDSIPEDFSSFGVEGETLKPLLVKVMGVDDSGTSLAIEAIEYNHSLYNHVDYGTGLVLPSTSILPSLNISDITGLSMAKTVDGIEATWDSIVGYEYAVTWSKILNGVTTVLSKYTISSSTSKILFPLELANYQISITSLVNGNTGNPTTASYLLIPAAEGSSAVLQPTAFGILSDDELSTSLLYEGRGFTLGWTHDNLNNDISEFLITVSNGSNTSTKTVLSDIRKVTFYDLDLLTDLGEGYQRDLTASITVIDNDLNMTTAVNSSINNPPPPAPLFTISGAGDIDLSVLGGGSLPSDITVAYAYIWADSDTNSVRPIDSERYESEDLFKIDIPDTIIIHDNSQYIYEVGWSDSFGETGELLTRHVVSFDPALQVPVSPELVDVIPITTTSVKVGFTHDGTFLKRMLVEFRLIGEDAWIEYATLFLYPKQVLDVDHDFNEVSLEGYTIIAGLAPNRTYQFRARVANTTSTYSDYSDIIEGEGYIDAVDAQTLVDEINTQIGAITGDSDFDIDDRVIVADGVADVFRDFENAEAVFTETVERKRDDLVSVQRIDQIRADLDTPTTGLSAKITEINNVTVTSTSAMVQAFLSLDAVVKDPSTGLLKAHGEITALNTITVDSDSVLAREFFNIRGAVNDPTTGLAKAVGDITQLNTIDVTSTSALVVAFRSLDAIVKDPNTGLAKSHAELTQLNTVAAGSTSALVQAHLSLNATVTDPSTGLAKSRADIDQINYVNASSTSAMAQAFVGLNALVTDPNTGLAKASADITQLNTVTAGSDSALARAHVALSATVGDIPTSIATVDESAKAAIGYCTIASVVSSHETKDECELATGTWVNSPLASAVKNVQVTHNGETLTVGDFYTSYVDLEGNLSGQATLGLNASGEFIGLEVLGGSNYSELIFKGNVVKFKDTTGATNLSYNSNLNTWEFTGTVKVGGTSLDASNTLNSNTSWSEITGAGTGKPADYATANQPDSTANSIAANYANSYANSAYNNAVNVASSDATTKSDNAYSNAVTQSAANAFDKIDGSIAGWSIDSSYMWSGTKQTSNAFATSGVTLFNGGAIRAKEFRIDTDGSAYFNGDITGASGSFSGSLSAGVSITSPTITGASLTTSEFTATGGYGAVQFKVSNISSGNNSLRVTQNGNAVLYVGSASGSAGVTCAGLGTSVALQVGEGSYAAINAIGKSYFDYIQTHLSYNNEFRGGSNFMNGLSDLNSNWCYFNHRQVYFEKEIQAAGGITPFTASHIFLVENSIETPIGSLVVDSELIGIGDGISNAIFSAELTSIARDSTAVGAVARRCNIENIVEEGLPLPRDKFDSALYPHGLSDEWCEANKDVYDKLSVNSLGEGLMLVSSVGGDIIKGNLLCSSIIVGHAMRQVDEEGVYISDYKDFTVAKSRVTVIWSQEESSTKLIPIFYKGG